MTAITLNLIASTMPTMDYRPKCEPYYLYWPSVNPNVSECQRINITWRSVK